MIRMGFLVMSLFTSLSATAGSIRAQTDCPQSPLEKCRWEIFAEKRDDKGQTEIVFNWEKSVVSRHYEKPLADTLKCNVDRNFGAAGYIQVWFENEKTPCDPMKTNPADCGVTFLLDVPKEFTSARGFSVKAPAGKTIERVEHLSDLHLQCGDFSRKDYARHQWNGIIGWKKAGAGDGIYTTNNPLTAKTDSP